MALGGRVLHEGSKGDMVRARIYKSHYACSIERALAPNGHNRMMAKPPSFNINRGNGHDLDCLTPQERFI